MKLKYFEIAVIFFCLISISIGITLFQKSGKPKHFLIISHQKLVHHQPKQLSLPNPHSLTLDSESNEDLNHHKNKNDLLNKAIKKCPLLKQSEKQFSKTMQPINSDHTIKTIKSALIPLKITYSQQEELNKNFDEIMTHLIQNLDNKSKNNPFKLEELKRKAWRLLGEKYYDHPSAISILNHLEKIDREMFARGLIAQYSQNNPKELIDEILGYSHPRNDIIKALSHLDYKKLNIIDEVILSMSSYNAIDVLESINIDNLVDQTLFSIFERYENSIGFDLSLEKINQLIIQKELKEKIVFHIFNKKNNYKDTLYQINSLEDKNIDKYHLMGRLLQRWSENELSESLEFFDHFYQNHSITDQSLKKVLESWKNSPNSSQENEIKRYFESRVSQLLENNRTDDATQLLSALIKNNEKLPNINKFISKLSEKDPLSTLEWIKRHSSGARSLEWKKTVYANWAINMPEKALIKAQQIPQLENNESERAYAFSNIAIRQSQHSHNHNTSVDWINELPQGIIKDRSVAGYALGFARYANDSQAEYLIKKQFQLNKIDLEQVYSIINNSDLDLSLKDKFLDFR